MFPAYIWHRGLKRITRKLLDEHITREGGKSGYDSSGIQGFVSHVEEQMPPDGVMTPEEGPQFHSALSGTPQDGTCPEALVLEDPVDLLLIQLFPPERPRLWCFTLPSGQKSNVTGGPSPSSGEQGQTFLESLYQGTSPAHHILSGNKKHNTKHWFWSCVHTVCKQMGAILHVYPFFSLPEPCKILFFFLVY